MTQLTWLVLTVSFFNTLCLLWLGLMVLLIGNRRSPGVWLTGSGLLLGALFFTSHTAIFGRGLSSISFGMDFWWWLSWIPAVTAPLAWYSSLLWYSGLRLRPGRFSRQHLGLAVTLSLGAAIALLLVFANPLPTYAYVAGRMLIFTPGIGGIPYLVLAYLLYSLLCYLLPLDLLKRAPLADLSGAAAWGAVRAARAHRRARPWLSGASLALLLAGGVLSWAALWALTTRPLPALADSGAQLIVMRFDLAVQLLVAVAITLLGRAIVGFEVFTGRAMPRGRFFRHWRSTLLLAGGFGAMAAFTLTIELRPIYSLMLAAALMILFYALYTWRNFVEREDFMARLRPFIASQDLYASLTGSVDGSLTGSDSTHHTTPAAREPANHQVQFHSLCADLLEVRAALLLPSGALATLAGPGLVYPPGAPRPTREELTALSAALQSAPDTAQRHLPADYEWAVPLWASGDERHGGRRRLCGILLLAEKTNRAPLTEEEMQIAQAAGERLVDSLAAAEMARLALDLLRQRLAQTRVLEGQGRRVLHDEVLPELHTAILYLSEQAAADAAGSVSVDSGASVDAKVAAAAHLGGSLAVPNAPELMPVALTIERLVAVHRRISDLMRELPLATPHRLATGGLAAALPDLLSGAFATAFQRVVWDLEPAAAERARVLPLFSAEVLFFAVRELVRNAARYARGGQPDRPLTVWIALRQTAGRLILSVEDDGVGMGYAPFNPGDGLRIHTALLAAIGASFELSSRPGGGLKASIVHNGSRSDPL